MHNSFNSLYSIHIRLFYLTYSKNYSLRTQTKKEREKREKIKMRKLSVYSSWLGLSLVVLFFFIHFVEVPTRVPAQEDLGDDKGLKDIIVVVMQPVQYRSQVFKVATVRDRLSGEVFFFH